MKVLEEARDNKIPVIVDIGSEECEGFIKKIETLRKIVVVFTTEVSALD